MTVRDQLVRAGVELLEQEGLASLSQRRIATVVGVSHGAPRHYFPTFAALLAAIARVGTDELDTLIRESLAVPDARSAVSSAAEGVVRFAGERPGMFELMGRHDLLEGAGENLRGTTASWLELLTNRLREIRPEAGESHGLALWAGIQGLGTMIGRRSIEAIAAGTIDPEPVLAVLVDDIIRGE